MEKRIVVAIFLEIVKRVIIIQLLDDSIVWETITNEYRWNSKLPRKMNFSEYLWKYTSSHQREISLKSIFTRTNRNVHCSVNGIRSYEERFLCAIKGPKNAESRGGKHRACGLIEAANQEFPVVPWNQFTFLENRGRCLVVAWSLPRDAPVSVPLVETRGFHGVSNEQHGCRKNACFTENTVLTRVRDLRDDRRSFTSARRVKGSRRDSKVSISHRSFTVILTPITFFDRESSLPVVFLWYMI